MVSDDSGASDGEEEQTTAKDLVVTKYNMAAEIANDVLRAVLAAAVADTLVGDLCILGDRQLAEKTAKVFKKEKEMKKGIAFPTCVSVNNCACHYSPLTSDFGARLVDGDVVKVDLGAHIDGFIAVAAHTVVVGASADKPVDGKVGNAMHAAYNAMELVVRMLRPGQHKNMEITDAIQRLAECYECKPVENMLSHQLKRNKIDGEKQIIQNPGEKQRSDMEKCEFEQYEVYAVDILMSTGEGKLRDLDAKTSVFKKDDDVVYQLKMKMSRTFFSEAVNRFGAMPFSLRAFDDEKKAKMGVGECERHLLMKPYPVMYEREGESVVQFKCTVLLMPGGLLKITGLPLDAQTYKSELTVTDEKLAATLSTSLKPSKKKPKKKEEPITAAD